MVIPRYAMVRHQRCHTKAATQARVLVGKVENEKNQTRHVSVNQRGGHKETLHGFLSHCKVPIMGCQHRAHPKER